MKKILYVFGIMALCVIFMSSCKNTKENDCKIPDLSPPGGWSSANDAVHPLDSEGYYEWWYLDTKLDNGYTAAVTFYWRQRIGTQHISLISIDIYKPDGTKMSGNIVPDTNTATASIEKCDVKMGENFLIDEGNQYRMKVVNAIDTAATYSIGAELTFLKRVPSWKWSENGYLSDDTSGIQAWVNPIPRADVEGKLFINSEVIDVSGVGYHDHNWGNIDMSLSHAGWGWGRMYDPVFTFVYGWFISKDGEETKPQLYLAMDDKVIFASNQLICTLSNWEPYTISPGTTDTVPNLIEFHGEVDSVNVDCKIEVLSVLEAREHKDYVTGFASHYYRRVNKFTGTVTICGKEHPISSTNAINEWVTFVLLK